MSHIESSPVKTRRTIIWGVFLSFVFVALISCSNDSFWIDEFITARFAVYTNWKSMWLAILDYKSSELQMPLYMTYVWIFEKIFGHSEIAMRLSSLPVFCVGMTLLTVTVGRHTKNIWALILAFVVSPYAWYYLNEARLSAIQIGLSAIVVASLVRLNEGSIRCSKPQSLWLNVFIISVVSLAGTSMLGGIWAGAAVLALLSVAFKDHLGSLKEHHTIRVLVGGMLLSIFYLYYLWSLTIGARATLAGTTNLQTFAFIFYEQLGFVGLGPGRIELRELGIVALLPYFAVLTTYAVFVGIVMLAGIRQLLQAPFRPIAIRSFICISIPALIILLAGIITHFRVLGRHFAPLQVIILLILGIGIQQLWTFRGWMGKVSVAGFVTLTLFSCLQVRFAQRHMKDDYRQAAMLAKTALAQNKHVWWNANRDGAAYYGVPMMDDHQNGAGVLVIEDQSGDLSGHTSKPDIVIASKQDLYDKSLNLANYLSNNGYDRVEIFNAFSVWEKKRQ